MTTSKMPYSDEFKEQALAKVYSRGERTIQSIADEFSGVESGKVCVGARLVLRMPVTSVLAVLSGIERNRQIVSCASAGDEAALLIGEVDPTRLTGGVERVASKDNPMPSWKVVNLLVEAAPRRWWEFWI